jgi:hypothetical protein
LIITILLCVFVVPAARSAAADRDHDFEPVAVGDRVRGELAARNDLAVALDCDAFACEAERFDELREAQRLGELATLSVDRDRDHLPEAVNGGLVILAQARIHVDVSLFEREAVQEWFKMDPGLRQDDVFSG